MTRTEWPNLACPALGVVHVQAAVLVAPARVRVVASTTGMTVAQLGAGDAAFWVAPTSAA
jgi:hypothetical protein